MSAGIDIFCLEMQTNEAKRAIQSRFDTLANLYAKLLITTSTVGVRRRQRMWRLCQWTNNKLVKNTEIRVIINFTDLGRIKIYLKIIALID